MTDELLKKLLGILNNTQDFVLAQAPDIAKQLITLARIESSLLWLIPLLLTGIVVSVWRLAKQAETYPNKNGGLNFNDDVYFLPIIVTIVSLVPVLLTIGCNYHTFLTSWFAPKVYLLEYVAKALKAVR